MTRHCSNTNISKANKERERVLSLYTGTFQPCPYIRHRERSIPLSSGTSGLITFRFTLGRTVATFVFIRLVNYLYRTGRATRTCLLSGVVVILIGTDITVRFVSRIRTVTSLVRAGSAIRSILLTGMIILIRTVLLRTDTLTGTVSLIGAVSLVWTCIGMSVRPVIIRTSRGIRTSVAIRAMVLRRTILYSGMPVVTGTVIQIRTVGMSRTYRFVSRWSVTWTWRRSLEIMPTMVGVRFMVANMIQRAMISFLSSTCKCNF